jgi:hypothetical protein
MRRSRRRRRRRRWWWRWWCLLLMWGCTFSVFSGLVVGGDRIFGVSCRCGDASFLCFQDDKELGMQVFLDGEEVQLERLADVGIEEEEEEYVGNHVRKEPVPYCVNYKESVP